MSYETTVLLHSQLELHHLNQYGVCVGGGIFTGTVYIPDV